MSNLSIFDKTGSNINKNEEEKKQPYFNFPVNVQDEYSCYGNPQNQNTYIQNLDYNNSIKGNNISQINNNSNLYLNIINNKTNISPFLANYPKNGNIIINYTNDNINKSHDFNIYNYSNHPIDINNCNKITNNHNDIYINCSKENNFSFYLNQNDIHNRLNLTQYKNNNLNNYNINIFPKFENLNKSSDTNNNNINIQNTNKNMNFDGDNINIFNNDKQIFNSSNINNYFNNFNNINISQNNLNENKNQLILENSLGNNNVNIKSKSIINSINSNILDDFTKYINTLPMPLVNFLCTPKGTLEIQKKLEKSNNDYKILLINLLNKQGLPKIMKNTYGNYFFQQLIKKNEKSLISLIISYISEDFLDISKDFSGTFSLQALLDEISSFDDEQNILKTIKNKELEMAFDKNATHVLQKIVQLFPDNHRAYLNEIILQNFIDLSLDPNGICLIKIFIKTNTLIYNKKRINVIIINNFVILAESPFGNYGIQYLMEIWNNNELMDIKDKILENIYKLSLQQFSSNVVEKAIEIFEEDIKIKMIRKLCFENNFTISLLKNKFGKFVLNKAIKYMKIDMRNEFEIYLINDINNNIYKNKDRNKIKKLLLKLKNTKYNKSEIINNNNINNVYSNNFYYNNIINTHNTNNYNNIGYNRI